MNNIYRDTLEDIFKSFSGVYIKLQDVILIGTNRLCRNDPTANRVVEENNLRLEIIRGHKDGWLTFDPTQGFILTSHYSLAQAMQQIPQLHFSLDDLMGCPKLTDDKDQAINSNVKAVNDYICPTCKNDRCSKSEKTCWRCGFAL